MANSDAAVIEARYRKEHADNPAMLSSVEDVDRFVDALRDGSAGENLAQLHSLSRPLLSSGCPDHELLVGVNGASNVGMLAWMDASGNFATLGVSEQQARGTYSIMGEWTEFPEDVEVPLEVIRQAVKDFLISEGRPTCVEWQTE
ncbi:Imm1 family immunity protein [Actinoplanes teichomyceticus]|uniref:Imm1 family immunity protein n=1 Tax=Actinoplanes teichomyceticus TaxID=1867 RepID=UPI00119EFC12|nr:Imm1 family immunity protein [Actinoplanes teichomyceticus]GIF17247.1 hypothetical protein Ate01nite_72790 [Actinoplanes teichomyceticus]